MLDHTLIRLRSKVLGIPNFFKQIFCSEIASLNAKVKFASRIRAQAHFSGMKLVPLQVRVDFLVFRIELALNPIVQTGIGGLFKTGVFLMCTFVQKHTPIPLYWPWALYGPWRVFQGEIMAVSSGHFCPFFGRLIVHFRFDLKGQIKRPNLVKMAKMAIFGDFWGGLKQTILGGNSRALGKNGHFIQMVVFFALKIHTFVALTRPEISQGSGISKLQGKLA